jgi:hypothetical protein
MKEKKKERKKKLFKNALSSLDAYLDLGGPELRVQLIGHESYLAALLPMALRVWLRRLHIRREGESNS